MALERFIEAQKDTYTHALEEIRNGRKRTHWMWFIFPQLKGLGSSRMADYYGVADLDEATRYYRHPLLGSRLIEITNALLLLKGATANAVFGYPDDLKLHSSMTLFSLIPGVSEVFQQVLDVYFEGKPDLQTLQLLRGFH